MICLIAKLTHTDFYSSWYSIIIYYYCLVAVDQLHSDQQRISPRTSREIDRLLCVCAIAGLAASAGQLGKEEDAHPSHERQHEFGGERQRDNREDGLQWPEDDHVHQ